MADGDIWEDALAYHRAYPPGKLGIVATKPLANQRDLGACAAERSAWRS